MPPPPDEFPPEWKAQEAVSGGPVLEAVIAVLASEPALPEPTPTQVEIQEMGGGSAQLESPISGISLETIASLSSTVAASEYPVTSEPLVPGQVTPPVAGEPLVAGEPNPPYILPPAETYAGEDLHMITVVLRPGVDKVRDNLRLRQTYGILISYSGRDRFALQIFERNRGYRVEFPNFTTALCPELLARLGSIVGSDNVIVEPLTIH
jgi:hypothetical protein